MNDTDTKLGLVTKRDKRNTTTSNKFENDAMSANFYVIFFFPIYDQFGAIQNPDSGPMVYKAYIFINNNLLSYKNRKQA